MQSPKCVKCGGDVDTDNPDWRTNRWCAPCCTKCRNVVAKETSKDYSMWPSNYRGGWMWDDHQWELVTVHSDYDRDSK
jgi:hypothetical protein